MILQVMLILQKKHVINQNMKTHTIPAIISSIGRLFCRRDHIVDDHLIKVGTGFSGNSINTAIFRKNSIASHNGIQYISYYDKHGHVILGKRQLGKTEWTLKKQPFKSKIKDAHNIISIEVDGDGYIHMAYGMHARKLNYAVSCAPGSLHMISQSSMDGKEEYSITYPEFYRLPTGDLIFVYRSGKSGNGNIVMKRYVTKDKRWHTISESIIDGNGARNAYWQMCVDKSGKIHISWVWRETSDVSTNHDLCYACSDDYGLSWYKSDGTPYSLPITMETAETIVRIPQNSSLMNQGGIDVNSAGHPYICTYWQKSPTSPLQYHVVWFNGTEWNITDMGNKKTSFALKGTGTKKASISRPCIICNDNKVYVLFRDEDRGSVVSLACTDNIGRGEWEFIDLTQFSVDAWEPTIDTDLWKENKTLNIFVQNVFQLDGNDRKVPFRKSTPVYILELIP